jgi:hypothetical protein
MAKRAMKPASRCTQSEVNRVAIISASELAETDPTKLCLLKRKVKNFDDLEVADHPAWVLAVAAITNSQYRKMFHASNHDRLRYRYAVYGWEDSRITIVLNDLTTALP